MGTSLLAVLILVILGGMAGFAVHFIRSDSRKDMLWTDIVYGAGGVLLMGLIVGQLDVTIAGFNFSKLQPDAIWTLCLLLIFINIKNRNRTIPREKAPVVLKRNRNFLLLLAVMSGALVLLTHFQIYPALNNAFTSSNQPVPILLGIAPYSTTVIIAMILILALYGYFSKSVEKEFNDNLRKHQTEKDIRIRDLTGKRINLLFFLMFILWTFVLIQSSFATILLVTTAK